MPVAAVIIDIGAGHAHVGDQVIDVAPAAAGPTGSLAVGPLVLRPLTFGERLRLVREVAGGPVSTDSARALAASVLSASLVTGDAADAVAAATTESVALHLSGARLDVTTPGFADSAGLLAQAYGWGATDVTDAAADLIDDLARSVADALGEPADDGWTSVVLADDTEAAGAGAAAIESDDVEGIRDRLAMDLLRRDAAPFFGQRSTAVGPAVARGRAERRRSFDSGVRAGIREPASWFGSVSSGGSAERAGRTRAIASPYEPR